MSEIEKLLPHRDPFLFVDKLEKADEEEIIGYRTYKSTEHFFKGHFFFLVNNDLCCAYLFS